MITIISAIIGFIASLIPALLKIYEKKQDYSHEYELRRLEIEAAEKGVNLQARLEQIKAVIEQNRSVYEHDQSITTNETINNIRASIRPVITYAFFGLFVLIKLIALITGVVSGLALDALVHIVWDEYTAGIFVTIITFWYGTQIWQNRDILNALNTNKDTTKKS